MATTSEGERIYLLFQEEHKTGQTGQAGQAGVGHAGHRQHGVEVVGQLAQHGGQRAQHGGQQTEIGGLALIQNRYDLPESVDVNNTIV